MIYYVIPCREGSKGVIHKNRILWNYTMSIIPKKYYANVIVTSDDPILLQRAKKLSLSIIFRNSLLSSDCTSIRDVMKDVIKKKNMCVNDHIIMLYLTYPNRTWLDIKNIYAFYKKKNGKSLLCSYAPKTHPYLCFYNLKNFKGEPIVKHDLYRRQDYPFCFALSHFVCIFNVKEINNLNKNMYNRNTLFYPLHKDNIDIDTQGDLFNLKNVL